MKHSCLTETEQSNNQTALEVILDHRHSSNATSEIYLHKLLRSQEDRKHEGVVSLNNAEFGRGGARMAPVDHALATNGAIYEEGFSIFFSFFSSILSINVATLFSMEVACVMGVVVFC